MIKTLIGLFNENPNTRVYVSFEEKTLKVDGKYWIKNGILLKKEFEETMNCEYDNALELLEELFIQYKYSIPSERSEKGNKRYFKALDFEDIPLESLAVGLNRNEAKAYLETAFLIFVLTGSLKWTEDMGSFFWQSKTNPDFVILRSWVD